MRAAAIVCVVLAAGRGTRFGNPKGRVPFRGVTFADRALAATAGYRTIVVGASDDDELRSRAHAYGAAYVCNDEPARGMTHSFRLALAELDDSSATIAILLVDTPLVDANVVERVIAASFGVDIAYPVDETGRPGHPVVMGTRVRAAIAALPDGDTLRMLRDDVTLTRKAVAFADSRPFVDIDVVGDLESA